MLVIRLFRVGKKNQPSFKIVVTDKRSKPRAGRFVEKVGFYNSLTKEKVLKGDRIKYWLSVGAKPSSTIFNLLVSEKILEGKKIPKHKKSKKPPEDRTAEMAEKSAETAAQQEKLAESPKEDVSTEVPPEAEKEPEIKEKPKEEIK
jgi:small subunit ribosomal protein S16